ncbi:MAG TPA: hypothetical protein VNV83_05140 [Acidimicrobiales bacterium]|jgi:hypothetical protein|nr:hypothetical protein [Acidimicrobiales bacterium]
MARRTRWEGDRVWSEVRLLDADGEPTDWVAAGLFMIVEERPVLVELRIVPAEDRIPEGQADDAALKAYYADLRRRKRPEPRPGEWSQEPEGVIDTDGVPIALLRRLTLMDLYEDVQEFAQNLAYTDRKPGRTYRAAEERRWRQLANYPGSAPKDDLFYARWAERIATCTADPETRRNPIAAVAERTGVERSSVRDIAHNARRKGLLTRPPSGGRGGGYLTDKAKQLLEEPKGKAKR